MGKIIGIIFGKKNTPWQRIDAEGNVIDVAAGEFDAHPVYAGIQDETIDGQRMVRVPAFYYRSGRVAAGEFAGKRRCGSATSRPRALRCTRLLWVRGCSWTSSGWASTRPRRMATRWDRSRA